jgi:branched-chain amino acid transport system permease protein
MAVDATPAAMQATSDFDMGKALKWGALGGLSISFVAAIGMVETLDKRMVIDPILSLGFLALIWVPLVFAYIASSEEELEGIESREKGGRELATGVVVGAFSGLLFGLFIVIVDTYDLREIFPNLSDALVELLTFGKGVGTGVALWVLGSILLGLMGAAAQLLTKRLRSALFTGVIWTIGVALAQIAVTGLLEGVGLDFLVDWLYAGTGGLTIGAAIVIFVVAGALGYRSSGSTTSFRDRYQNLDAPRRTEFNIVVFGLVVLAFILLPMIMGTLVNELFANVGLFLMMALGLNVVVGYAGMLDLGYVAFFAVGAYTTAVLTSPGSPFLTPELTLDFVSLEGFVILVVVIAVSALAGILVGTPVIRLRGDYLAIVTLGFGEIVRILFLSDWSSGLFGGAQGIINIPSAEFGPVVIKGTSPQAILYLAGFFVAIAIYASWRLQDSRVGRAWAAIREDEDVAATMGINPVTTKLLAFVIGAIIAGMGGMVFAVKVGSVFPISFRLLVSLIVLVVVIVGGMGSIPGVIVGAVILIGVLGGPTQPGLLAEFQEFKLLVYGLLLILMMLKRPEGLVPSRRRQIELHQDEFYQDAWLDKATREEANPDDPTLEDA